MQQKYLKSIREIFIAEESIHTTTVYVQKKVDKFFDVRTVPEMTDIKILGTIKGTDFSNIIEEPPSYESFIIKAQQLVPNHGGYYPNTHPIMKKLVDELGMDGKNLINADNSDLEIEIKREGDRITAIIPRFNIASYLSRILHGNSNTEKIVDWISKTESGIIDSKSVEKWVKRKRIGTNVKFFTSMMIDPKNIMSMQLSGFVWIDGLSYTSSNDLYSILMLYRESDVSRTSSAYPFVCGVSSDDFIIPRYINLKCNCGLKLMINAVSTSYVELPQTVSDYDTSHYPVEWMIDGEDFKCMACNTKIEALLVHYSPLKIKTEKTKKKKEEKPKVSLTVNEEVTKKEKDNSKKLQKSIQEIFVEVATHPSEVGMKELRMLMRQYPIIAAEVWERKKAKAPSEIWDQDRWRSEIMDYTREEMDRIRKIDEDRNKAEQTELDITVETVKKEEN